jgi:GNAT superfamily N-acetyltransferase
MMDLDYIVTRMSKDEIPIAIAYALQEGWNPGRHDHECFYQADPRGFFAGKLNGKIIAVGSAVVYDDHYAFCGFYIVDPNHRTEGYGLALAKSTLDYVGSRNAGLDAVLPMIEKYERFGFKQAYRNARYTGINLPVNPRKNSDIIPLSDVSFEHLCAFDRHYFPAERRSFLRCWANQPGSLSLGYVNHGQLLGYGVIRECFESYKIGPLFADSPDIADDLFNQLVLHAKDQPVSIAIPECNSHALDLVARYPLEKGVTTARMYLKNPLMIDMENVYGITSFELG